jgi:acyl-coenzyme A synthetase/AMP-(fatty) acid ligase
VLLGIPGVAFAKVYGVPSSLLGQLVKADVVIDAMHSRPEMQKRIHQVCAERLPDPHRPRLLNFIAKPDLLENGKIQRA